MQSTRASAETVSLSPSSFAGAAGTDARGPSTEFQWRVLALLNGYRLLVALLMLALFYLVGGPRAVGAHAPLLFLTVAFVYLLVAVGAFSTILRRRPSLPLQLYVQVMADIAAITLFLHASGGIDSGLGNLLVVSVGAASVLVARRQVGVIPAVAAFALLAEYGVSSLHGAPQTANSMSTGLLGATLFVIALAGQPLVNRLRESEALAQQRGVDLANMAELNHYVLQHLRESLVVIDADNRIRLTNGAALTALGLPAPAVGRRLGEVSPRLQAIVDEWRRDAARVRSQPPMLVSADGGAMLAPQIAELGQEKPSALLIFLEDQSVIVERAQQSKLAALGRLSASIAHEIRNPVGAMSHAAQLLAECPDLAPADRRLTAIIHDNAMRISSIVDNVLQLSRPGQAGADAQRFELADWVNAFVSEYLASNEIEPSAVRVIHEQTTLAVRMDPTHLHQILWNLCDNALKYGEADSVGVRMELVTGRAPSSARPYLEVRDFGAGIDDAISERIFEPFFTSGHGGAGGTGLGLFIARQLAECNGANLANAGTTSAFERGARMRLVFADPDRWTSEARHATA